MRNLSGERKAVISGFIAGLTFFYTSVPDPEIATKIMWLRFIGELSTISLSAYYFVWVAPNEPIEDKTKQVDPRKMSAPK